MKHFHTYHDSLPKRYKEDYVQFERRWNYYKKRNAEKNDRKIEEFQWLKRFVKRYFLTPYLLHYFNQNILEQNNNNQIKIDHQQMYYFDDVESQNNEKIELGWSHDEEMAYVRRQDVFGTIPDESLKTIEKLLMYPNFWLPTTFHIYKKYSVKPLSKDYIKRCRKMVHLSGKIIKTGFSNSEFDIVRWKKLMAALDNDEIRIYTMEFYFSQPGGCNLMLFLEKNAWKYYLLLLKKNDYHEKLLDTFSKYCRFFIEDSKMKEKYRAEIERIGRQTFLPVSKWWIDTIKFETHFGNLQSSYAVLERALKAVFKKPFKLVQRDAKSFCKKYKFYTKKIIEAENAKAADGSVEEMAITEAPKQSAEDTLKSNPLKFSVSNRKPQFFSLPEPIVYYMLKNAASANLQKLFTSCKHFFHLQSLPVCYRLMIQDEMPTKFIEQSIFFSFTDDIQKLQNFYLANSLQCIDCQDRTILSKILSQLHGCDAKYINIQGQDLTVAEFIFLTKNCKYFENSGCKVIDKKGVKHDILPFWKKGSSTMLSTFIDDL